ncbi:hypothetical protein BJ742DRAFT_826606 [Cladochytrium replicatum]|nr:hypothetical protein BJ742DRAFT_826606 [Cladochytrium replicatum]
MQTRSLLPVLAAALALLVQSVHAIPLHAVNAYDAYGNTCPAITKTGLACPILCVPTLDLCPPAVAPVCEAGTTYCFDGTCKANCTGVANICTCSSSYVPRTLLPCKGGLKTTVTGYDPGRKDAQIREFCAADLKVGGPGNVTLWTDVLENNEKAKNNYVFNVCDNSATVNFTYTEPLWISVFTIVGAYVLYFAAWTFYKNSYEAKYKDAECTIDDARLVGFQPALLGTGLFIFTILISLGWFVFLIVMVNDYYTGYTVFLGSYPVSAKTFSVWWAFATLWIVSLSILRSHVRNFFRLRSPLDKADFIKVERKRVVVKLLNEDFRKRLLDDDELKKGGEEEAPAPAAEPESGSIKSKASKMWAVFEDELRGLLGFKSFISTENVQIIPSNPPTRYIEHQSSRYVLDAESKTFAPFVYDLGKTNGEILQKATGLVQLEAQKRLLFIGQNFIEVNVPPFPLALWNELTGFFYLYQAMILWLFYYLSYWQVGVVDTGIILLSAVIKTVVNWQAELRIKKMAEHSSEVKVRRDDEWVVVSSQLLVPGDIIALESNKAVPVDGILLSGDLIVDESSLTGEALPVRKVPIKNDSIVYDKHTTGKIHSVFAGTTVLQATGAPAASAPLAPPEYTEREITKTAGGSASTVIEPATALVLSTRTSTDKGKLIHKILFQEPVSFIFQEQLKLVFFFLLIWGFVLMGFGIAWLRGVGTTAFFYGMFCISQVMSPLLPAILVVGQARGAAALRNKGIYSVDLPRIIVAGKVRIFAFDKTGTLTREGMQYQGVLPLESVDAPPPVNGDEIVEVDLSDSPATEDGKIFAQDLVTDFAALPSVAQNTMIACHTVGSLDGVLVGNPVDVEMFSRTGWSVAKDTEGYVDTLVRGEKKIHIVKRFEFQHAQASMAVVVLDPATGITSVHVKGSFEKVKELVGSENVPGDYETVTARWAKEGCYVLAMASRVVAEEKVAGIREWAREEAQRGVKFDGLLVFRNTIKEDTKDAILKLKEGDTRTVMITGDNALTGVFVARQASMIPAGARVLIGDVLEGASGEVIWTDVDTDEKVDLEQAFAESRTTNIPLELAVTEKAVNRLSDTHVGETDKLRKLLLLIRVFGRTSPEGKVRIVNLHMERGITAMCGDGGNDSGALRAAHVGLAMAETEASVVAPFSTGRKDVGACVDLLIEGRAALATSFASYKYLIMYGEIMAMLKLHTFYFSISFSNNIWIFVDSFIVVILSFAVTISASTNKLAPQRPTARILGPETLASVIGQIILNVIFTEAAFILLYRQDWFRCHEFDARSIDGSKWWLLGDNFETVTLTVMTLFQFINCAAVFNFGGIYRASWYKNYILVGFWAIFLALLSYVTLADPNLLGCWFRLNCGDKAAVEALPEKYVYPDIWIEPYNIEAGHNILPRWYRPWLWALGVANVIASLLYEKVVVLGFVRQWVKSKKPRNAAQIPL